MVENTLDEETEAGGVDGIQLRSSRGALVDHYFLTAPKYCGKWLVDENNWRRVKQTYQKQVLNNQIRDCEIFTRRYCGCNKGIFICAECYATHFLDADT